MKQKLYFPLLLIFLFAQSIFSQTAANVGKNDVSPEIRKDSIILLRETSTEVNNLRTLENRISFSAELAGLMWFEDEKEARTMFQSAVNDFRQLLVQLDVQIIAAGIPADEERIYARGTNSSAQMFRKFMKAAAVRRQMATAISEHDPKLALDFFNDTASVITHPAFRKQIEGQDGYFVTRLLQQIAEKDVDTALKYARKSLEKGLTFNAFALLKKIYDKDADKGIAFGADILAKLKTAESDEESLYIFSSLLKLGAESFDSVKEKSEKKPIFGEQSLREIADLFAQQILKRENLDESSFSGYITLIERFTPARAAQIRQKFKIQNPKTSAKNNKPDSVELPMKAESDEDSPEKLLENVGNLGDKQLSKEEREKSVAAARKIIGGIKDPNQKIFALSALALQIAKAGDQETAIKIMDESRALINFPPKTYEDFMKVWLVAGGFAEIDADKAFPILEDAIFRLNNTISAFVKVGEFMDTVGEMVEDGEIQVGSFGGDLTRGLMQNLGTSNAAIRRLAVADFNRTRGLTNKFERPEARILAKMLVLRAIFDKNSASLNKEVVVSSAFSP